jgi:hypothetical protein
MKQYEILYHDRRTEIVDHDTVDDIITELEMFERTDISQIHLLKDDGDFDTIWTEEEGLFVDGFGFPTRDDYDEDEYEYEDEDDYEELNEDEGSNDNEESNLKDTNYVVVVDYEEDSYLGDSFLLGWSNRYDWFDDSTCGYDILNSDNQVQKNKYGILIEVNDDVSVYVGETLDNCKGYCDGGNQEGYDCTVCKLEKDDDDYKLIPVYPNPND